MNRDSVGRIRDSPVRDSLPKSIFVTKSKSQRSLLETTILEKWLQSDFKFDKVSPTIKATGNMPKRVLHVQG